MKDIPIKSFVDAARSAQNINNTIAVDSSGESNVLLGGRAVGVLTHAPDNTAAVNQILVKSNNVFLHQLRKSLREVYNGNEIDRQYQEIAQMAGLLDDKGMPTGPALTVAQVEVVRIELAHRGRGSPEPMDGGNTGSPVKLSEKSKQYLLNISRYEAGRANYNRAQKEYYNKARKENEVDSIRPSAPQEELSNTELDRSTKMAWDMLKKLRLGRFVDRQLVKLGKSGINEADRNKLESRVILEIANDCSRSDFNPFESEKFTEGFIWEYRQAEAENKVTGYMSKNKEQCQLLASELNNHPLTLTGKKLTDHALQEALAWAGQWMKASSRATKSALNAASSKVQNIGQNAAYDANAQLLLRAYGKFRKNRNLKKQDIAEIANIVLKEFRTAADSNNLQALRDRWHAKLPRFACDVSRAVIKSKARSKQPQETMMVVRHRLGNNKPEKGSVPAGNPGITQQKAFNELVKLGFGKELNTQLARLEKTISDAKHRALACELLILQAHAGYINLKQIFMDENDKQLKVPSEEMSKKIKGPADEILYQYGDEKTSSTLNRVIDTWRTDRNKLAADFKADI